MVSPFALPTVAINDAAVRVPMRVAMGIGRKRLPEVLVAIRA